MDCASEFCWVRDADDDDAIGVADLDASLETLAAATPAAAGARRSGPRTTPAAAASTAAPRYRVEADTNVVSLKLGKLSDDVAIATGDATFCTSCKACVSSISRLVDHRGRVVRTGASTVAASGEDEVKAPEADVPTELGNNEQQQMLAAVAGAASAGEGASPSAVHATATAASTATPTATPSTATSTTTPTAAPAEGPDVSGMEEGDLLWMCEFCGTRNVVSLDIEEVPASESVDYVLEAAPAADTTTTASTAREESDGIVVFAIDTSGSMCVTTEVAGRHALKGDRTRALSSSLIAHGDAANQWFPGQRRDVTYVSRLQSVTAAVTAQIEQLKRDHPSKRVALVSFSDEVVIMGDGTAAPRHLAGTRLTNFDQLVEAGSSFPLDGCVKDTADGLVAKVHGLEEGGATALGPALLVSLLMASRHRGSKVVVCTDGLANVGLGAVEDDGEAVADAAEEFYRRVGLLAVEHGVVIDLVGIEGEGCDVETLGLAVEPSGGSITKVAPLDVTRNFASMLANEAVATKVSATMFLHKMLKFRNTQDDDVAMTNNRLMRHLGNVAADTEVTFEYSVLTGPERAAAGIVGSYSHLPFQVQIHFTKLNGMKCVRVISQSKPVTRDRSVAERAARPEVLATHAAQQAARLARRGSYTKSRVNMRGYQHVLNRCAVAAGDATSAATAMNYAHQMRELDEALDSALAVEETDEELGAELDLLGLGSAPRPASTSASTSARTSASASASAAAARAAAARAMKKKKLRGRRRKKNDGLSKAIHGTMKATSRAMRRVPSRSPTLPPVPAPAPVAASAPGPAGVAPGAAAESGRRSIARTSLVAARPRPPRRR